MVAQGIAGDFASIGKALGSLFNGGGFDKFFEYLFDAVPGIGVFLIIYALMMFVSKITLFREPEHHKYAHMVGIGIALIGITNDSIYTFLVDFLAGSFLQLFLILFVVFGLMISLNYLKKHLHIAREGNANAAAKDALARTEEKKALTEFNATEQLDYIELSAEMKANKTAENLDAVNNDALKLVDEMQGQLSHAAALQSKGESTRAIRQGILDRISSYVSSLHNEFKSLNTLKKELNSLELASFKELKIEKNGDVDVKHLTAILNKDPQLKKTIRQNNGVVLKYVQQVKQLELSRQSMLKRINSLIDEMVDVEKKTDSLRSELTRSLESGNIAEASSVLGAIRDHLNRIKKDDGLLRSEISNVAALTKQIENFHKVELKELVVELKRTQEQEKEDSN